MEVKTKYYVRFSPTVADGRVYVGFGDGYIYCLDKENGGLIWKHSIGRAIRSSSAVVDEKIYVGSWDCKMYCLEEKP